MRKQVHLFIGIVFFLGYAYCINLVQSLTPTLFLVGLIGTLIGSMMPDIFEPAKTSRHRGLFHSRPVLTLTGVLFLVGAFVSLFLSGPSGSIVIYAASCFLVGYASHLLADSLTPAGLPE